MGLFPAFQTGYPCPHHPGKKIPGHLPGDRLYHRTADPGLLRQPPRRRIEYPRRKPPVERSSRILRYQRCPGTKRRYAPASLGRRRVARAGVRVTRRLVAASSGRAASAGISSPRTRSSCTPTTAGSTARTPPRRASAPTSTGGRTSPR